MQDSQQALSSRFPERRSTHAGSWVPLYMEPLVGSGERLCIGVAAADDSAWVVVPVDDIGRFSCVYGAAARSFSWAAELTIMEAQHQVARGGLASLADWSRGIDGLSVGAVRTGAGTGLADLARLALQQVSSLVGTMSQATVTVADAPGHHETRSHLESEVRRLVIERRPTLRAGFGRQFRRSQSARPLRYGFVGRVFVANFAALSAHSASSVSAQVDRAKARLWDLKQLDDGILSDSLPLGDRTIGYELLVNQQRELIRQERRKLPGNIGGTLRAAEEELEAEADKYKIQVRLMRSPRAIADYLIEREAA